MTNAELKAYKKILAAKEAELVGALRNREGIEIEKALFMVHGENTTVCRWKISNRSEILDLKSEIEIWNPVRSLPTERMRI